MYRDNAPYMLAYKSYVRSLHGNSRLVVALDLGGHDSEVSLLS